MHWTYKMIIHMSVLTLTLTQFKDKNIGNYGYIGSSILRIYCNAPNPI